MKLIAGWNGGKTGATCPNITGPCCGPVFYTPMGLGTETDAIVVSEVSQERADWKADQIALRVNNHERLVKTLAKLVELYESEVHDSWDGTTQVDVMLAKANKARALLAAMEAEKWGEL